MERRVEVVASAKISSAAAELEGRRRRGFRRWSRSEIGEGGVSAVVRAPRPTVRISSSAAAAAAVFVPPREAVPTASLNKRKAVPAPERRPEANRTASSKRMKTIPALGHPAAANHQQNRWPSAAKTASSSVIPPIPIELQNNNQDEPDDNLMRIEYMKKRYAGLIAKAEEQLARRYQEDLLKKGRHIFTAEEVLFLRREAQRARARDALQEAERKARRNRLRVGGISREHLRELAITAAIEYTVSPEGRRGRDGVLRFTRPLRRSPLAELGFYVKADHDDGELELDEEY
ncbi:hypothetical protein GUJ93_ZPchr0002g23894 [Zizania palustris]|uniref:Uncharacterized protein n=1 Tax=Zizania palustris TaxID=103762 RepID=A0A8J5S5L3_ZIZPA|nr:hypothetical protein GUJ93_ZPchr0002g23894 [Zizania palustris]